VLAKKLGRSTEAVAKRRRRLNRAKTGRVVRELMEASWSSPAPVALMQLKVHHCRYVVGDVNGPRTLYCGERKATGSSYCARHHALTRTRVPHG
jgi:hypothetical protein